MKRNLLVALLSVSALSLLPGCGDTTKKVVTEEKTTTVEMPAEEVTAVEVRETAPVEEEAK
jgi:hypothetical protein